MFLEAGGGARLQEHAVVQVYYGNGLDTDQISKADCKSSRFP
jgi:hypothetical protein